MSLTSTLFNPYSEAKILVFQPPYYLYFESTLQVFKPHFSPNPSIFDWETLQRTNVLKDPLLNVLTQWENPSTIKWENPLPTNWEKTLHGWENTSTNNWEEPLSMKLEKAFSCS